MQNQIKPVNWPNELPLYKHCDLFNYVRRLVWSKTKSKADNNDNAPGQFIKELFHGSQVFFN